MPELSERARPSGGLGHYLRDVVYGASDGVVTTLAILSGTSGAAFDPRIGIVLGLANLVADGLSMGASNYLGLVSELEQTGASVAQEQPWRHGAATALAFAAAGAIPLLAYAFGADPELRLQVALGLGALTLAGLGATRALFSPRPAWRCALEMVLVAGAACAAAYLVGIGVEPLLAR
jgi:VIT1/CCC1 family predicted Fe2+/Mn2+ transporter